MLMSMSSHSYSSYSDDPNDDIDVSMNSETLTHTHTHMHINAHYIGCNLAGVLLCWCLAPSMEVCLEMNLHIYIHTFTCKDTYIQAHSCGVSLCPAAVNSVFKR